MDMMTRSAVLAASLVVVAIAAGAGWWFLGDTLLGRSSPPPADFQSGRDFDDREGSLLDEFGEDRSGDSLDDRITIVTGRQLDIPPPPVGTVAGLPDGPQFGWDQTTNRQARPLVSAPAPMPRNTPSSKPYAPPAAC